MAVPNGFGGQILFNDNSSAGNSLVEVFGNGIVNISQHNAPGVTIGAIEGSGNVFLGSNNLTVGTVGLNNFNTAFSGIIHDGAPGGGGGTGGSLTKIGTATLALSGANTYTGGTTVTTGTLLVNNTSGSGTGSGAVAVNGGTLGGTSSGVSGAVTVASGATLNAGTSVSSQGVMFLNGAAAGLSLQSNSIFHFDLGGTTPGNGSNFYDQINITNGASIAGSITGSVVNGFTPGAGDVYFVLSIGGTRSGVFVNAPEESSVNLGNGFSGEITYQANWTGTQAGSSLTGGNDVAIFNIAAVPEPSIWAMMLLGSGGLLAVQRFRHRSIG